MGLNQRFRFGTPAALRRLPVVLMMAVAAPAGADVTVAITPASITVDPGSEFEVLLEVTAAGSRFNAFDLIVGFDPAALTAVPIAPLSAQVGAALKAACPSIFNDFHAGISGDTIGCSMLCAGASMTGPGEIYRLRFRASQSPQATTLAFIGPASFYDAGIRVSQVQVSPCAVTIGTPPLGAGHPAPAARLSVRVAPNPVRSGAVFIVQTSGACDGSLAIVDLQGRELRRFPVSGTRQLRWDGTTASGTTLPPGIYQVVVRSDNGANQARTRMIVLR